MAILVGWLVGGEDISWWTLGGMLVILAGVALVRGGAQTERESTAAADTDPLEVGCGPVLPACEAAD